MLSFLPTLRYERLTDILPEQLSARGISLLLMDFDNTMLPYTTDEPTPELLSWLRLVHDAGITLCIVSNSRKPRVPKFSAQYGVPCVTRARKPGVRGIREALRKFQTVPSAAALVGDQIYTDVLGANLAGVTAIHVRSIHNHTVWLKLRHLLELPFLALSEKRRITKNDKS